MGHSREYQGPSMGKPCDTVNAQSCRFTRDRPSPFRRGAHCAPRIRGGRDHSNSRKIPSPAPGPPGPPPAHRQTSCRGARRTEDPDHVASRSHGHRVRSRGPPRLLTHHFPYTWRPTLSPRNNAVESNVQAYPRRLSSARLYCTVFASSPSSSGPPRAVT
jgi:hypothetical protein